jgi:diphosphomevalonate decarboxylase
VRECRASALAHANIAFIKYWGNRDDEARLPANASLSMALEALHTITTVLFDARLPEDDVTIDGQPASPAATARVARQLDLVRQRARLAAAARVVSRNNFPSGAGLASSASAFAALTLAACTAAGLQLDESQLSALARRASGSACRSVPGGFAEWEMGQDDATSFARSLAPPGYWQLRDVIALVSREAKPTSSAEGHRLAAGSPLQAARLAAVPDLLAGCRQALLKRDLAALGTIIEQDAMLMHAVMLTSRPPLIYWSPATLEVLQAVREWRAMGVPAYFTMDAGPNVHLICEAAHATEVAALAARLPGVLSVQVSAPGGPARLVEEQLA